MDHSGHMMNHSGHMMMDHSNHSMMMMGTTTMDPHAHHHMNMETSTGMNMHNHGGMGMNMNGSCSMPGMLMYFHTGNCEYILFQAIVVSTPTHLGIACLVMFILSMSYEGLKFLREYLLRRSSSIPSYSPTNTTVHNSQEVIITDAKTGVSNNKTIEIDGVKLAVGEASYPRGQMLTCSHFIQTVLHMLQVFVSYCLMLVFMTYNVWLGLSIILGAGAGYFLFGWKRAVVVDINEHCH